MSSEQSPAPSSDERDRTVFQADPDQPLSEAVIVALATDAGLDDPIAVATEFGPLYDAIDPDALDALFESSATTDRSGGVTFTYADRTISVDSSGRVEFRPLES